MKNEIQKQKQKQKQLYGEEIKKKDRHFNTELKEERHVLMGKIKKQAQFVDNSTEQNRLYKTQIRPFEIRVQNLMDKIQQPAHGRQSK